ncbi:hypothetical protein QBC40DRAFT_181610 [Triangularia verruculosa]|uniref:Uncharacterized protein n=1 Tax=Triangularia verruculosa TaxID=2587418 RepID=A0AAN6XD17_9PEZI|nr:hypothetical protein QBC40DRAFT_181610 [Triangularia verruculosa]
MRGAATNNRASSQGLTLPMRYIMRKRLKSPEQLEVTERRQVGDVAATVNPGSGVGDNAFASGRGRDSEL